MTEPQKKHEAQSDLEAAIPPILGSWPNIYLVVLGLLVSYIGLFTLFTRMFS